MNRTARELKNVMVVDDDDDYNFITEEIFQEIDLKTQLTFKIWARDALDYLKENEDRFPDLILLDINMPIMNGWEFLEEYENRNYHINYPTVIVMISTSVFREDKVKANSFTRVVEFVEKPISGENILRIRDKYFSP
jgi:CheY-like chemotaxis protein